MVDTDVLEHHLKGLDGDSLAALVADLWAARGYETTREGATVRATHGADTLCVLVVRAAGGQPRFPAASVDVVVAPGSARDGDGDARVVDAATLAELLAYAVDRPVARELCERHLGATPAALPAPPLERFERGIRNRLDGRAPVLVAATLLLGVGVVLFAGAGSFAAESETRAGDGTAVTTPADAGTPEGVVRADRDVSVPEAYPSSPTTPPPGVTSEGVTDLGALASAHEDATANRSHTLWLDRHSRHVKANGTGIRHDIDMVTDGDRYRVVTTRVEGDTRQRLGAVYYDGTARYGAVANDTTGEYDRVFRIDPRHDLAPTPQTIGRSAVWRYLSTEETTVTERTGGDGTTTYRVVATGKSDAMAYDRVWNYTAVAVVDARGYVRDLTVGFTGRASGRIYRVRHEITYGRVGSTTVDPPAWYERHRENATAG